MTAKNPAQPLPSELVGVQLIDAATAAAVGSMSHSWWLERVASGNAPLPAVRAPRCTRWRLTDVRAFWAEFAESGDPSAGEALIAKAVRASAAAKAARIAKRAGVAA